MRIAAGIAAMILLAGAVGCSSSTSKANQPSTSPATSSPSDTSGPSNASNAFPTAGPVPSGPLGGNYCDPTAAHWTTTGSGITVSVTAPAVSEISIQVVDSANNPIGDGTGQISVGGTGQQIDVPNVSAANIGGVSLSIAGATSGTCVVEKG